MQNSHLGLKGACVSAKLPIIEAYFGIRRRVLVAMSDPGKQRTVIQVWSGGWLPGCTTSRPEHLERERAEEASFTR